MNPVEFEFEAAKQALINLRRKLEECEYYREASTVIGMVRDLSLARERYNDPL